MPLAAKTVAEAVRERGGDAQQVRQVATDLQQKTLAEVARLAAQGDAAARTAIHVVKNVASQYEKYQK